jgi:hypothetical protein
MPVSNAGTPARVVVVSGLPRSGTSLMMQMLEAGGLPVLTDALRTPDNSNPKGYLEYEPVKRLKEGDTAWVTEAQGKVVKIISSLLTYLPASSSYDVIFMMRPLPEVLASQRKMLIERGRDPDQTSDTDMTRFYEKHLDKIKIWLAAQANIRTHYIEYPGLLAAPAQPVTVIAQFLKMPLNETAMMAQIDSSLYRNRVST